MNIFRSLITKTCQNQFNILHNQVALQNKIFMTLRAERKQNVPTHRNEFLPFTMNNIWDNPGAKKQKRRIGRGPGSTKGKTAGRGHNGQKSRSGGGIHPRFEGGQSSIVRRLPKMGMSIRNRQKPIYINLNSILYYIQRGTIDPTQPITIRSLYESGAFKTAKYGIKILGKGGEKLKIPLNIEVTDASEAAIKAIKDNGGSVTCTYKTKLLMREAVLPHKFPFKLRDPIPSAKHVRQMERIRERGAEVVYKVPEWKQKEFDELKAEEKEDEEYLKKQQEEFTIPVPRHAGVGRDKIRKRKPVIWRTINYGL